MGSVLKIFRLVVQASELAGTSRWMSFAAPLAAQALTLPGVRLSLQRLGSM
jgi:hypothetical protein